MTRSDALRLIPILQAYADGKDIEYQRKDGVWQANGDNDFSIGWRYRIKPEPREWWLVVINSSGWVRHACTSQAAAEQHWNKDETIIHVREVTP